MLPASKQLCCRLSTSVHLSGCVLTEANTMLRQWWPGFTFYTCTTFLQPHVSKFKYE